MSSEHSCENTLQEITCWKIQESEYFRIFKAFLTKILTNILTKILTKISIVDFVRTSYAFKISFFRLWRTFTASIKSISDKRANEFSFFKASFWTKISHYHGLYYDDFWMSKIVRIFDFEQFSFFQLWHKPQSLFSFFRPLLNK